MKKLKKIVMVALLCSLLMVDITSGSDIMNSIFVDDPIKGEH